MDSETVRVKKSVTPEAVLRIESGAYKDCLRKEEIRFEIDESDGEQYKILPFHFVGEGKSRIGVFQLDANYLGYMLGNTIELLNEVIVEVRRRVHLDLSAYPPKRFGDYQVAPLSVN